MPRVLRTAQARADLISTWLHIAENSSTSADRVARSINEACALLADMPRMGRPRPELGAGLRSFASGSYVIFYRPLDDGIEVIRVLHGARDVAALF